MIQVEVDAILGIEEWGDEGDIFVYYGVVGLDCFARQVALHLKKIYGPDFAIVDFGQPEHELVDIIAKESSIKWVRELPLANPHADQEYEFCGEDEPDAQPITIWAF